MEANAYATLKREVQAIAAGQRTDTAIEIPLDELGVSAGPWTAEALGVDAIVVINAISSDAVTALRAKLNYDYTSVVKALLVDCPYDMYWCDKTTYSSNPGGNISAKWENGEYVLYLTSCPKIIFYAAVDYSATGAEKTTTVSTDKITTVNTAIANAQQIVENNSDKSGKALLAAYRDAICGLTTYDYDAVTDDVPYGDPWQLINVFDGDSSTNVVCEGYAKAFKYLCDLSSENLPDISCLIATGVTTGNHMWNVVNMEDNRSYLVDITACDSMDSYSVTPQEYTDTFFLSTPSSGTYNTSYSFSFPGARWSSDGHTYSMDASTYIFSYDQDTLDTYATKYLTLSTTPYTAYSYVPANAATCDTNGNIAYYTSDGKYYVLDENGYTEVNAADVVTEKLGHRYGEPEYSWSDDGASCIATANCENCFEGVMEQAVITSEIITSATYTEMGWTKYTATFINDPFSTQTKDVQDIQMLVGTEVVIEISDINGIKSSTTVYAETFHSSELTLSAPYMDGYDFSGWRVKGTLYGSTSAAKTAITDAVSEKPSEPISVAAVYATKTTRYSVTVTDGKLSNGKTSGSAQVSSIVTVKANTPASGKKFSHWTRNGVKVSSNSTYSFRMPSYAVSLKAVYVDDASSVEKVGTAIIENVTVNGSKVSFVSVCNIPDGCTMVKGGLVATSKVAVGENVTVSNASYVKLSGKITANTKNLKYTWTKGGVTAPWYVRGYLVYRDASGAEHTVYSDAVKADTSGIIETYQNGYIS